MKLNSGTVFNRDNITKSSILENHDSISSYLNFACQQNQYCFEEFYNLLAAKKPKRILEIGTALGGLTVFLKQMANELGLDTIIRSYDINSCNWYDEYRELGVDIRVENIFEHDYLSLKDTSIIDFIQDEGVTIVLCDGGSKKNEFDILSDHIKPSDIIMAHDYAYDRETFELEINNKYWNWHEISESDIAAAIERNNLSPYMQEGFTKAVWVCKVKD